MIKEVGSTTGDCCSSPKGIERFVKQQKLKNHSGSIFGDKKPIGDPMTGMRNLLDIIPLNLNNYSKASPNCSVSMTHSAQHSGVIQEPGKGSDNKIQQLDKNAS